MIGFIIFGMDTDMEELGVFDPEEFDVDDLLDEPSMLVVEYSYFHIFWLFGFVTSKSYMLIDPDGDAVELDSDDVEDVLDGNPIGFMHRFGLLLLIGIIILLGAVGGAAR